MREYFRGAEVCLVSVYVLYLHFSYRKERDRAREEHTSAVNKMFNIQNEGTINKGAGYSVIPHKFRRCVKLLDGFIYVANAEAHKSKHYLIFFLKALSLQSKYKYFIGFIVAY